MFGNSNRLWMAIAAAAALFIPRPVAAATPAPYTATGWLTGVPVPGVWFANASGQMGLRGNAHTLRVQSADARLTGQRLAFADGAVQTNGTTLIYGTAYQEVGTWDLTDPTDPKFTPTGGLWELTYHGTMPADYSLQLHVVGRGSGGSIEGWRFEEDATLAAGAPWDPANPYHYTGTIKAPPVNTTQVVDNFDDGKPRGIWNGSGTYFPLLEANQQLTVRGKWPGLVTRSHFDTWDWPAVGTGWSVANNRTLECRVDLVSMSENATNAAGIVLWSDSANQSCIFMKGRDFVQVGKWVGWGVALFFHENVVIKNSNVVLSLALTRVDPNVVLTARVLDKANQGAVLYERSVMDTPNVDRTLTSAELKALSGMNLTVMTDVVPAITSGSQIFLSAFQYTDGKQPELDVTYDNLELWTYEVPRVGIDRAVRLSWPASVGINYAVEAAPSVTGPWLPVAAPVLPGMTQLAVPVDDLMQVFRLRQAP